MFLLSISIPETNPYPEDPASIIFQLSIPGMQKDLGGQWCEIWRSALQPCLPHQRGRAKGLGLGSWNVVDFLGTENGGFNHVNNLEFAQQNLTWSPGFHQFHRQEEEKFLPPFWGDVPIKDAWFPICRMKKSSLEIVVYIQGPTLWIKYQRSYGDLIRFLQVSKEPQVPGFRLEIAF